MENYINAVANETAIPIDIITAIIAFIAQLISNCVPTPKPADVISGGAGLGGRYVIYRAMFANDIRPRSAQGQSLYQSMVAHAATLSTADAEQFLALAK